MRSEGALFDAVKARLDNPSIAVASGDAAQVQTRLLVRGVIERVWSTVSALLVSKDTLLNPARPLSVRLQWRRGLVNSHRVSTFGLDER